MSAAAEILAKIMKLQEQVNHTVAALLQDKQAPVASGSGNPVAGAACVAAWEKNIRAQQTVNAALRLLVQQQSETTAAVMFLLKMEMARLDTTAASEGALTADVKEEQH